MALYVPASRRRRNAALVAAATLIVGLVLGYLVGHSAAPSVSAEVSSVKTRAERTVEGLSRLPIEYEQALTGADSMDNAVIAPTSAASRDLVADFQSAPWISATSRSTVLDAV